ncbi:hypothetical protein C8A01DRAFT_41939 [Parachaetomium inaequale]|uniref:Sas10 C-terminal domain-containing protein n=1 Tax=Parachaetomium inaequale TaxID=2588326 RepID=A0AAN6P743_9PEZI|nr:hypothetical protein C8A01DRAFT_41939 [Parachaetomium inaequale]
MLEAIRQHPYLAEFADVFSKESNELPPSRECDHEVEVEPGHQLRTSPLYSLTLDQLETMRKYLKDCLERGFIVPSSAPFASPVLLNAGTVKNRYPLPLIDETLRQLGKADRERGLTPHRKKEVRNPRVKKRMKYEERQKKLRSVKAVYKGGEGPGRYQGELSCKKTGLVKIVKL